MSYSFPYHYEKWGQTFVRVGQVCTWPAWGYLGLEVMFPHTGTTRRQAASTVFSWFHNQECRRSLHFEVLTEHCQYVYKDIQTGNCELNCHINALQICSSFCGHSLTRNVFTGWWKNQVTNVQVAGDMAWCVPCHEAVSTGCESELDRPGLADTSTADSAVKHPCKSKFSEKGVFLVDYCFVVGLVYGLALGSALATVGLRSL